MLAPTMDKPPVLEYSQGSEDDSIHGKWDKALLLILVSLSVAAIAAIPFLIILVSALDD